MFRSAPLARRPLSLWLSLSLGALSLSVSGCEGCLGLDQYQVVPTGGNAGNGASGGTGGGAGGTGGAPACGSPGLLFASAVQGASPPNEVAEDPCTILSPTEAGIEIRALDSEAHTCVARARIIPAPGVTFESLPRIRSSQTNVAFVAATFRGGPLTLPPTCGTDDPLTVEEPPGATDTLLLATLQHEGTTFCTGWARRAWTEAPGGAGSLRVHALDIDQAGDIAAAGSLGPGPVRFEIGESIEEVSGGPFFARFFATGALAELSVLAAADPGDAILGMFPRGNQWVLTGAALREQPVCQGCTGTVDVQSPAAAACPVAGGSGGTGGVGGTGGTGGATGQGGTGGVGGASGGAGPGGSGGVGGVGGVGPGSGGSGGVGGGGGQGGAGGGPPLPDARNGFLWPRTNGATSCSSYATFGSDSLGDTDAQAGFGLSLVERTGGCLLYTSGLAGRAAWPFSMDPATALFDSGGGTMDGFIAGRFGAGILCDGPPEPFGPIWNVRLTPLGAGASAVAEHVSAQRCTDLGLIAATAFVRSEGSSLATYRCTTDFGCDSTATILPLPPGASSHLVILGLAGGGEHDWSFMIAPIRAGADAAAGSFAARSHHDITRDGSDDVVVIFTTDGPLQLENTNAFGNCEDLVEGLPQGTYVIALRQISGDLATCDWFYRIDP